MVLIFSRANQSLVPSWRAVCLGAAVTLSLVSFAHADTLDVFGCVGGGGYGWGYGHGSGAGGSSCVERKGPAGDPYVRTVPAPKSDEERERSAERDHKWLARCRPIVAQDRYGVPRYHYAAPGCEFGVIE